MLFFIKRLIIHVFNAGTHPIMTIMKKFAMVGACVCWLSACGFHLKGRLPYDALPVVQWQIDGQALQTPLENALRYAQGQPVVQAAQAIVRVEHYHTKKDIYTITRAAKLNEYLLSLRVVAQAYRPNGQAWGKPIEVQVRRTMSYSDSMILGKQEDEATLWQEIQQDAAEQIVRQLAFLK